MSAFKGGTVSRPENCHGPLWVGSGWPCLQEMRPEAVALHHVNWIVRARLPKRPQAHLGQSTLKAQSKFTFIMIYGDARPSTRLSSWKDQLGDHNLPAVRPDCRQKFR